MIKEVLMIEYYFLWVSPVSVHLVSKGSDSYCSGLFKNGGIANSFGEEMALPLG